MRRALAVPALALLLAMTAGCTRTKDPLPSNVRPPRPGTPVATGDVTGIYRSIHQGLLQLRAGGELILVVPGGPGATSGTFTLTGGRMAVQTKDCKTAPGEYDVEVTGEQEAGKAVLHLSAVSDPCEQRRHYLTVDPWIYANS